MRGKPGPIHGGRYDREFQARFAAAVRSCAGKVKQVPVEKVEEASQTEIVEEATEAVVESPSEKAEA
jgi:hypothetical protein